ncbi:S9 family peptidase [Streptomyces sp. TLI_171]|uniref:alpha/beta hydrolase family protein n=1 Tax=Streptomyces sp. TLI_171 TaxID=1938859 RepID=UPI000C176155|nr:alpha/beta hydrolase [Streptomyces sp. TLI_171]RKE22309.1 putative esterase [Streptomyces sp. TLI_171]
MTEVVSSTVAYGPRARPVDLHRPVGVAGPLPTVLLWHGRGADERDVLAPLARTAAALGVQVLVPDWRPDDPDGGRAELRASAAFARERANPAPLTLAGWSLGAKAAVAVALNPAAFDAWRPHAVVAFAGSYDAPAPSTGTTPLADLPAAGRGQVGELWLLHGSADTVVDPARTRELHAALLAHRRPVTFTELPTDHAGIIGTAYSPEAARCLPSTAPHALAALHRAAETLATAARSRPDLSALPQPGGRGG